MKALIYLDGKVVPPEKALVSVMDRGFLFGDGVYEAGRSYDRCYLYLEEHWSRFRSSAAKLSLEIPWSDDELTQGLHAVSQEFGQDNACFRTICTRGRVDTVGLEAKAAKPTLVHVVQELPKKFESQRSNGVVLDTSRIVRNASEAQDPNIKTSNYLNSLLAQQDVQRRTGRVNAVLCDGDGNVAEGTNFSVFGVNGQGELLTPALEVGILESITRRHVLALAKQSMKVREGRFSLKEFHQCQECFIVSSTREILPVSEWDAIEFPVPGKSTASLHESLKMEIRRYVETHQKF